MSDPLPPQNDSTDRLVGWKAIAGYVGVSERTAIRRAKIGMPVHRLRVVAGDSVYASKTEVEAWLRMRQPVVRAASFSLLAYRRTAALLAFATVLGVVWSASYVMGKPRNPASWQVADDSLIVFDQSHREVWRHRFDVDVIEGMYGSRGTDPEDPFVTIADLDGDGRTEVLARVYGVNQSDQTTFYCFEWNGAVRFTYEFNEPIEFGEERADPPFPITRVFVDNSASPRTIVVVAQHGRWFPAVVARLTASGAVAQRYWSNGHVTLLSSGYFGNRRVLFVGGVNNERKTASLAIVGTTGQWVAPAESPRYRCVTCTGQDPLLFALFPPSTITKALGIWPTVVEVVGEADGGLLVTVQHLPKEKLPGDQLDSAATVYYRLDSDLRPAAVTLGHDFMRATARAQALRIYPHEAAASDDTKLSTRI